MILHVSYDVEFRAYEESFEGPEREVPISKPEAEQITSDVERDITSMPEGDWPYDIRVFNIDVAKPEDKPQTDKYGVEMSTWDNFDMEAAFETGLAGMGRGLWARWLRARAHNRRNYGIS